MILLVIYVDRVHDRFWFQKLDRICHTHIRCLEMASLHDYADDAYIFLYEHWPGAAASYARSQTSQRTSYI